MSKHHQSLSYSIPTHRPKQTLKLASIFAERHPDPYGLLDRKPRTVRYSSPVTMIILSSKPTATVHVINENQPNTYGYKQDHQQVKKKEKMMVPTNLPVTRNKSKVNVPSTKTNSGMYHHWQVKKNEQLPNLYERKNFSTMKKKKHPKTRLLSKSIRYGLLLFFMITVLLGVESSDKDKTVPVSTIKVKVKQVSPKVETNDPKIYMEEVPPKWESLTQIKKNRIINVVKFCTDASMTNTQLVPNILAFTEEKLQSEQEVQTIIAYVKNAEIKEEIMNIETDDEKITNIGTDDGNYCVMCWEALTADSDNTTLECEHDFHTECIRQWGQKMKKEQNNETPQRKKCGPPHCPLCREDLSENDLKKLNLNESIQPEPSLFKQEVSPKHSIYRWIFQWIILLTNFIRLVMKKNIMFVDIMGMLFWVFCGYQWTKKYLKKLSFASRFPTLIFAIVNIVSGDSSYNDLSFIAEGIFVVISIFVEKLYE